MTSSRTSSTYCRQGRSRSSCCRRFSRSSSFSISRRPDQVDGRLRLPRLRHPAAPGRDLHPAAALSRRRLLPDSVRAGAHSAAGCGTRRSACGCSIFGALALRPVDARSELLPHRREAGQRPHRGDDLPPRHSSPGSRCARPISTTRRSSSAAFRGRRRSRTRSSSPGPISSTPRCSA